MKMTRIGLVVAVVFGAVASLSAALPWSATMTVGTVVGGDGANYSGYAPGHFGSMSDQDFTINGTTHIIGQLVNNVDDDVTIINFRPPIPTGLELHLDDERFSLDDLFAGVTQSGLTASYHLEGNRGWSEGDQVRVQIYRPETVPALPVVSVLLLAGLLAGAGLKRRRESAS